MGWDEQAQEVGAAQEPVLRPKRVHLRRSAQDGHGRLEGGQQGQGHGQAAHGTVSQQKLLRQAGSSRQILKHREAWQKRRSEFTWVVRWRPPEKA